MAESEAPLRYCLPSVLIPESRVSALNAIVSAPAGSASLVRPYFCFRQFHHAAPFRGLVGQGCHQGSLGHLLLRVSAHRYKRHRLPVAMGNGAGLVQKKHVHVAGRLNGAA